MSKLPKNLFKKTLSIILGVILVIIVSAYFLFFNNKNTPQESIAGAETENEITGLEKTYTLTPSKENSENNVYTDSQYRFSFQYPKDFTVTKFQEGEYGNTILVQEKESKESFQIFISPFDEPGPLTAERVKQDLPNMVMENPENRVLKNDAVALIFFSEESSIGKTREIWFIHPVRSSDSNEASYHLYQISTYKELDGLVAEMLGTWKFQ